jgi:hypothetical protein
MCADLATARQAASNSLVNEPAQLKRGFVRRTARFAEFRAIKLPIAFKGQIVCRNLYEVRGGETHYACDVAIISAERECHTTCYGIFVNILWYDPTSV